MHTISVLLISSIILIGSVLVSHTAVAFPVKGAANAQDETAQTSNTNQKMAKTVVLSNTWARATFALAKTGAAYMSLQNPSANDLHLRSVSVSDEVASMSELHHTKMLNDMMRMEELSDGVVIPAGETIEFKPGGKHIMLMGLSGPLEAGKQVEITLVFDDGSELTHIFPIKDAR